MKLFQFLVVGVLCSLLLWACDPLNSEKKSSVKKGTSASVELSTETTENDFAIYDINKRVHSIYKIISNSHPYNDNRKRYARQVPGKWIEEEFYTYNQSTLSIPKCPNGRKQYKGNRLLFHDEFGIELIIMVSYAHWLHRHCFIVDTISSAGSDPLYYFSDSHKVIDAPRQSIPDNYSCCPLNTIHVKELPKKFLSPNYKSVFHNELFHFQKPILIISNKYQQEWNSSPKNFFPTGVLVTLLEILTPHYTVIYNRPTGKIVIDGSKIFDLDEKKAVKQHGGILLEDLRDKAESQFATELPFNLFQMWVYSNAINYIAVQGGNSIYASHLAGVDAKVAILIKRGRELNVNSMDNWYGRFSGANVTSFKKSESLIDFVKKSYVPAPDYTPPPTSGIACKFWGGCNDTS